MCFFFGGGGVDYVVNDDGFVEGYHWYGIDDYLRGGGVMGRLVLGIWEWIIGEIGRSDGGDDIDLLYGDEMDGAE